MKLKKIGIVMIIAIICIYSFSIKLYASSVVRVHSDSKYTYSAHVYDGKIVSVSAVAKEAINGGTYHPTYSLQRTEKDGAEYWVYSSKNISFSKSTILGWSISNTEGSEHEYTDFKVDPDKYNPDVQLESGSEFVDVAGRIVTVINVIGVVILIATVMILGIKYMVGSLEQRAEYKKSMIPILIGAIMLFSISSILNFVYSTVSNMGDASNAKPPIQQNNQYKQGYDAALQWLKTCYSESNYENQLKAYETGARNGDQYASGYYQGLKDGPKQWRNTDSYKAKENAISFLMNCKSQADYDKEHDDAKQKARQSGADAEYWNAYYKALEENVNRYKTW